MRALGVMSLLVAGASAGIVLSDHSTLDRIARKAGVAGPVTQAGARDSDEESRLPRVFSPQQPLVSQKLAPVAAAPYASAPQATGPVQTVAPSAPVETATLQPRAVVAPAPVQVSRAAMRPTDEATRVNLARDIQTELRRVGCYDGNIDGDWGPAAKRAMKSFTDRVNAVLPMEHPDYILLTLVRGHPHKACGTGCAVGEIAAEGGRCIPKAVVAQGTKRVEPVQQVTRVTGESKAWPAPTVSAQPAPVTLTERQQLPAAGVLPGRMAVGAAPDAMPAVSPSAPDSAAAGVAAAASEPPLLAVPAPVPAKRKAGNGNGNGNGSAYRPTRNTSNDRSFKNPQVVREFFFGKHGG